MKLKKNMKVIYHNKVLSLFMYKGINIQGLNEEENAVEGTSTIKSRHGFGNFSLRPSNLVTNKQIFC